MKALAAVSLALLIVTTASAQKKKRVPLTPSSEILITTKYDKFSDRTDISPRNTILIGDNAMFSPSFSYQGSGSQPAVEFIRLIFIAPPQVWGYTSLKRVVPVLLDEKQPAFEVEVSYGSTFRVAKIVSSTYSTSVSISEFQKVACARKVEMRIGMIDGSILPKDLLALQALLYAAGGRCA